MFSLEGGMVCVVGFWLGKGVVGWVVDLGGRVGLLGITCFWLMVGRFVELGDFKVRRYIVYFVLLELVLSYVFYVD